MSFSKASADGTPFADTKAAAGVMKKTELEELKQKAREVRSAALESIFHAGSGHPGGSLSVADIMTYLYFERARVRPKEPKWPDRDRILLSKGHAAPAWYAVLAKKGYFPKSVLNTLRKGDSILQGHPDMKGVPGVDFSSGSLGQGLSVATGMAVYAQREKKDINVYCILGDGELQEGQNWEAALFAGNHKLSNLYAIVDCNKIQLSGDVSEIGDLGDLRAKFEAFGFFVVTCDGHDFESLEKAFSACDKAAGKPFAILCDTVKGKGVSFMEGNVSWHGNAPNKELFEKAMLELTQEVK